MIDVQCDENVIQGLELFASYNLITLGDLSTNVGVQNRTIICGSLTSSDSSTFASDVGQSSYSQSNYTLQLNGNISSGNAIQVNEGSFGVGTNPSHNIVNSSSPVQYTLDGRSININGGNNGAKLNVDNQLSTICQSMTPALIALSEALSKFNTTPGNIVSSPISQSNALNLYADAINDYGISVFNLDGNLVLDNPAIAQIELFVAANISSTLKLIVINLSGTIINFDHGNFVGDWFTNAQTGQSHTIWNFPEATTLTLSEQWMGALLAPYATVSNSAQINGATAVYSLTATAVVNNPPIALPSCI